MFKNFHYLDQDLNYASRVFIGYINGDIAAFCAVLPQPGVLPNMFRISRSVVLPDFQGLGLSDRLNCYIGELYYKNKKRLTGLTTHPGLIKYRLLSDRWKLTNFDKNIKEFINFDRVVLSNRLKASFLYIPINYNDEWDIN